MRLPILLSCALALGLSLGTHAQSAAPAPTASAAVQSVNIADVKPDASSEAGYDKQTNGERAKVQPGNNAPMWKRANGQPLEGLSSLPRSEAPEAGVLIQGTAQYPGSRLTTAGEAWRQTRNQIIIPYGGSLVVIVLLAVALFHWRTGGFKLHEPPTGRLIERFSAFERAAHMANAAAFTVLALSGVVMAFGKYFLLPVIGTTLFGWLSFSLKNAHNFAGPMFAVSLVIVIITFARDNLPAKGDLNWLLKGGGMFSDHEVKSGRFNAGEKVVFWAGVFVLGLVVVGSGLVMDKLVPGIEYLRATMQVTHMVHATAAVLMVAMFIGHIYLGTLGTEGAFDGMKTGYVDETWAKEHHELWYEDVQSGKIAAQRATAVPGGAPTVQA